ncbi:MAG TPA: lamin tail domain-containing protein [Verrucomicrobiales bacterium]|nr:lamin tail domain-containing protein [Verrucomicrobiales bacterium]
MWSAIVINEFHYDPEPKTERVEFIEFHNSGSEPVDLSGWALTSGVRFRFPEGSVLEGGGYLVLAEDKAAYDQKFGSIFSGGIVAFASWEDGVLANDGERIVLEDAEGRVVDEVDFRLGFPWPVAPGDNTGRSAELLHPRLENDLGGSWRASLDRPTPGKRNSVYTEEAPPQLRKVEHRPRAPRTGEEVLATVEASDPDGLDWVHLLYQTVEPGEYIRRADAEYETAWSEVPMRDDGLEGDEAAHDGVYSVRLLAALQQHRRLIRYRIVAADSKGNRVQAPFPDDARSNFAWFCYDGVPAWRGADRPGVTPAKEFSAETMNALPVFHLLARETDVLSAQYDARYNDNVYRFEGALVFDGEVYDHVFYRVRGQYSTYNTGKNKWRFRFHRGQLLNMRDHFGRSWPEPLRLLNLTGMSSGWNPANRGMSGLDEALAYHLFALAGVPSPQASYLHLRVVDAAAEASAFDQYEGDLWGPYVAFEQPDGRFLDARGLPDGNLFKMASGSSRLLNQGKTEPGDLSDLRAFVSASSGYNRANPAQPVEWWRENVDLDAYYGFRAVVEAINHSDLREQENSIYYHNPETGRWTTIPWDVDLLYEEFDRWGPQGVQTSSPLEQFRKCLQHRELEAEFQSRARELRDLLLNREALGPVVDEWAEWMAGRVSGAARIPVREVRKEATEAVVTTAAPHGLTEGGEAYMAGIDPDIYNGVKTVRLISPTEFAYAVSVFTPVPARFGEATVSGEADRPGWAELDRAVWDYHPRSRAVEGPSTGTGSFYINPFRYTRFPGKVRELVSADFAGMVRWVKDFTVPPGFGGARLEAMSESSRAPDTPEIRYAGLEGYPLDALLFEASAFSGGTLFETQQFAGMQWRVGEVSYPGIPGYEPGSPRIHEVEELWTSPVQGEYMAVGRIPPEVLRPGRSYRARVRMKNQLGHWSHWSQPHSFRPSAPDLTSYRSRLAITEIHYHPSPPSFDEMAAGFEEADFEFVEIYNRGPGLVDLSSLRFTKGIDFDFAGSAIIQLEAGAVVVVARNAAALRLRYGDAVPVAGEWGEAKLDNAGERLKLSYGAGLSVLEVTYHDGAPWPEEADGEGYSLEVRVPAVEGLGAEGWHWGLSRELGGSPGALAGESWEAWLEREFTGEQQLDPAVAAAGADPDGDGASNLFEFVAGSDPHRANPLPWRIEGDGSELTLKLPVQPGLRDVAVRLEESADLETWRTRQGPVDLAREAGGGWELHWRLPAEEGAPGVYYRIVVRKVMGISPA